MPTGVYKRKSLTEKHRINISESIKKNLPSTVFKKGQIPWNKNLTKETDERVRKYAINTSKGSKGKHKSPKTEFKKGNVPKNPIRKGEHRGRNTEFKKGQISNNKGKICEEIYGITKAKEIRKKLKEKRAKQIFPKKDTKIEFKIQNFLKKLGIKFFTHQYMKIKHAYQCDILIPSMNLIIECDGDYWHGNSKCFSDNRLSKRIIKQRELDKVRNKELIEKGFKVLRLWGSEIKEMSIEDFKIKVRFI